MTQFDCIEDALLAAKEELSWGEEKHGKRFLRKDYLLRRIVALETKRSAMNVFPGDYVKCKNKGGMVFYGDVVHIGENTGEVDVVPDGAQSSVSIDPSQVISLERAGRRRENAERENVSSVIPWGNKS